MTPRKIQLYIGIILVWVSLNFLSCIGFSEGPYYEFRYANVLIYSDPVFTPDDNSIVFTAALSDRQSASDIYYCKLDGSDLRNLTSDPSHNQDPSITPDGQYLIFSSDRNQRFDIYRLNLESGELVNLTGSTDGGILPSLSPDGKLIAYYQPGEIHDYLMVMDIGGKTHEFISDAYASSAGIYHIRENNNRVRIIWSADSKRLAFSWFYYVSGEYGKGKTIHGMRIVNLKDEHGLNTYNQSNLMVDTLFIPGYYPLAWINDDLSIVCYRYRKDRVDIEIINPDGSEPRRIYKNVNIDNSSVAWDSIHKRLAVASSAGMNTVRGGIAIFDSLGNKIADYTTEEGGRWRYRARWSNDGALLVYSHNHYHICRTVYDGLPSEWGKCGIFVMSFDGSDIRKVLGVREIPDSDY